ncbi:FAD/NAD(P)-binding domain-containing protein [Zopfia rhizophila CBS 207.26]|uniref:FAD/NAD(P)-binding domain-containing protein n=1 Tax=Zopfia rhizophila CBS 207.26 TaxID=1314779 RepID=A0A6A6DMQ8_9PEZI|nr:FAD/NAD(P)-binding domain-containing protein [Zopfia rhizophila CBS 207.26]
MSPGLASPIDTDVLIIGGGPAGLTAALALVRQLHTVILFDSGNYRYPSERSPNMHIVLGWDHKDPAAFRADARENITSQYDTINIEETKVENVRKTEEGNFEATDASGKKWVGKKLILASGNEDVFPDIDGYDDCWATGILHCFFSTGYESRNASSSGMLAVDLLTEPAYCIHAARHALQITPEVTIYTHGSEDVAKRFEAALGLDSKFKIDSRRISRLEKGPQLSEIILHFDDGTSKLEGFLGHAPITRQKGPFAKQLGLEIDQMGDIVTHGPVMQTSVKGVFAAGDCASPVKMVTAAMSMGCNSGVGSSAEILADALGQKTMFG